MLGKNLNEFKDEGTPSCKAELKQMHKRRCFKAISVAEITCQERIQDQEWIMLLTRERRGEV